MESLIKAGAMDGLQGTRAQLLLALDAAIETGNRAAKDRDSGQGGLFGGGPAEEHPEPALPKANDWTLKEKLQGEKELLGFYVTGHPLDSYEDKIVELATHDSTKLEDLEKGAEVALCGMITGVQKRRNREQKPWASLVDRGPRRQYRSHGFHDAIRTPRGDAGGRSGRAHSRLGAARRRQPDQGLGAGNRPARCGARGRFPA